MVSPRERQLPGGHAEVGLGSYFHFTSFSAAGLVMSEAPGVLDRGNRALRPPRFSLRTMLLATAACGGLFALLSALGAMWSMALLLIGGLLLAHVLGNSLGTRLRDGTTRVVGPRSNASDGPPSPPIVASRLTQRTRLGRVAVVISALCGSLGAFLGGMGSAAMYPEAGPGAVLLGVLSATVLGTFVGFVFSSFFLVLRDAWREALHEPPRS